MAAQIHVSDIGVVFRYTITDEDGNAVDISGATTKQIKYRSPGGFTTTVAATFTSDGTDGVLEARTWTPPDNTRGLWTAQVYLAGVNGFSGHSEADQFSVAGNL